MKTLLCPIALLVLSSSTSLAGGAPSTGGPYTVARYTVDSGGGDSEGGSFGVRGTIGQPEAGPRMDGSAYSVRGGFWAGLNAETDTLFNDGFE